MHIPDDTELLQIIAPEPWFAEDHQQRCETQLVQFGEALTFFASCVGLAMKRTHGLQARAAAAVEQARGGCHPDETLRRRTLAVKRDLARALEDFQIRPLRYLLPLESSINHCDSLVRETYGEITKRIDKELVPDAKRCLKCLDRLLKAKVDLKPQSERIEP